MRKRGSSPGRRLAAFGVVALALVTLGAAPKKSKSQRDGDLITITTHSRLTASGALTKEQLKSETEITNSEDSITLDETSSIVFRITGWTDDGDGIKYEEKSSTCELSVSGGGHTDMKHRPRVSWTYRKAANRSCGKPGISFYTGGGRGSISVPGGGDPHGDVEMVPPEPQPGTIPYAMEIAWGTVADAITNRKWPRRLGEVGEFTFDPKEKSISRSGSETYEFISEPLPGYAGKLTLDYKVSIGRPEEEPVEVEIIPPRDYANWMPQGDKDEKTIGNDIDIGIVAHKKGDPAAPPPQEVVKYTIKLEGTSREPGVDSNWPPEDKAKKDFDLKIDGDNGWITMEEKSEGQVATTKKSGLTDFRLTVNSYDWGGSTRLTVSAELKDHSVVTAHVRGDAGLRTLTLPRDDDGNHIADRWETSYELKSIDANADDDVDPPGEHEGDGIALFDEYRGFHIRFQHERISPAVKDLFVVDSDGVGQGIYGTVTGVAVHVLGTSEFANRKGAPNVWVVTPNGSHGDVYPFWLRNKAHGGDLGYTVSRGSPVVPRDVEEIDIDRAAILADYKKQPALGLAATIAHEMGHGTHIQHHGDSPPDLWVGTVICRLTNGTRRNFPCSGNPVRGISSWGKGDSCNVVARKGGKVSGNVDCFMRYDATDFYEKAGGECELLGADGPVELSGYGYDPIGTMLCTKPDGTGINATTKPRSMGNASEGRGNCTGQLCLNTRKH